MRRSWVWILIGLTMVALLVIASRLTSDSALATPIPGVIAVVRTVIDGDYLMHGGGIQGVDPQRGSTRSTVPTRSIERSNVATTPMPLRSAHATRYASAKSSL